MSSRTVRRAVAPCLLAAAVVLVGCGEPAPDRAVRSGSAGQDPSPATSAPAPSTTIVAGPVPSTATTAAAGSAGGPSPSAVEGLTPEQVKAAVLAPVGATARRATGPSLEVITLGPGATAWRVRIPGAFAARSARVAVSVGDRVVGTGIVTPQLDALVAVTLDRTGLVAGAPVSYRWEGSDPLAAGALAVAR